MKIHKKFVYSEDVSSSFLDSVNNPMARKSMQVQVRELKGNWDRGYALHKHTFSSICVGTDEYGHPRFKTTRTEPGEALYQLKYRGDWNQIAPLAVEIKATLLPLFGKIDLIIPMPASARRDRQPVDELAAELGRITRIPVFNNIVVKAPAPQGAPQLKNLHNRKEKDEALQGRFSINPCITNEGRWDVLLLDDLYDTGATMEAVCNALRTYNKINLVYVATITWK